MVDEPSDTGTVWQNPENLAPFSRSATLFPPSVNQPPLPKPLYDKTLSQSPPPLPTLSSGQVVDSETNSTKSRVVAAQRIFLHDFSYVEPFRPAIDALKRRETSIIGSRTFSYTESPHIGWPWCLVQTIATLGESIFSERSTTEFSDTDHYYVFSVQTGEPLDVFCRLVERVFASVIFDSLLFEERGIGTVVFREDGKTFLCMAVGYEVGWNQIFEHQFLF